MPASLEPTHCPTAALRLPDSLPECLRRTPDRAADPAARYGQIMPILARRDGGRPESLLVLGGIAHFQALKAAGRRELLCRIAPDGMEPERLFALRILSDRDWYETSPIAQAWILMEMREGLDARAMAGLLPLLGLKPHQAEERIALLRATAPVLEALHEGVLSVKNAALVRRLPEGDQAALIALVRRYGLGGSKQRNALELLAELCLREGRGVEELLADWRAEGPPADNAPQEARRLLRRLEARANPGLSGAEERFQERVRRLKPPPGWSIDHTPSFEDDGVSLRLPFSDWAELERRWPELLRILEKDRPDR